MNYTEKEIELFVSRNPEVLELCLGAEVNYKVFTQFFLADYGVADIVIWDNRDKIVYVLEVKKNFSTGDDFAQCLRYMGGIKIALEDRYEVKGIVLSPGMKNDVPWILAAIPDISHWTYTVNMESGLDGYYEPKTGWQRHEGRIGKDLANTENSFKEKGDE